MQNWLTNATKTRVIRELRKMVYDHPRYRGDHLNVQNKFSFEERPQRGIIVNGASADRVRLSADNYMGRLSSFVMQTTVGAHPGTSLEWVKENSAYLEQFSPDRSVFPTPPGVYLMRILSLPNEEQNLPGYYTLDPYLTVTDESLITFGFSPDLFAQLTHQNIYPNSLRLWLDGRRPILENIDFRVDYEAGEITFLKSIPQGSTIFADYRYRIETQGPFPFKRESSDEEAIPGAILAFGDRVWKDDQLAIVVSPDRAESAEVYGGKFEVSFELVTFSRDAEDREKFSDYVVYKILESQNRWGFEGLELLDVSPNGESEEIYNETLDDYFYDSTISLSLRVDWQMFVPLPIEIFRIENTSKQSEQTTGYLDGTSVSDLLDAESDISKIAGLKTVIGRDIGYERLK